YGGSDSATANLHVTGDINSVNQGVYAESRGYQDSRTSVTVGGNVVSENDTAVYVNAETGKTDVTVGGNAEGIDYGLDVWTSGNGKANVDVKGFVTGQEEGIDVWSKDKSEINVSVGKDVNSDENNAINIYAQNNSTVNAEIKGNVTSNEEYGASLYGSVNSDSEKNTITLSVDGDLRGELAGLLIFPENSKIDVLVTGTIYAGEEGAIVASDLTDTDVVGTKTAVNITVYKVEAGENGVVGYEAELLSENALLSENNASESDSQVKLANTASLNQNASIENSINYIIKLEQPKAGGALSALKADGTAVDKSFGYDVAKANQRVLLKVNLEDGYAVKGAYNGEGTKVALLKDSDGNYYVDVPKTGGVYLSVELEKTVTTDTTTTTNTDTTTTPTVTVTPVTTDTPTTTTVVTTDSPSTSTTVTTTTTTNSSSPKTGDSTNLMLVFGIMAMSVMGMVVISIKRRKDEE
ncbi:MAG: LPXTG cell wall anchor domain-containing protein, partial [Lachnospiraceae bacterium]|nr:LPXTG cell wall anchor domain-containing protein [Lachnospiraceae bacterium]